MTSPPWVGRRPGEPACLRVRSSVNVKPSAHRWSSQLHASDGDPGSVVEQWRGGRSSAGLSGSAGSIPAGAPPGVLSAHCSRCCGSGYWRLFLLILLPTFPTIPPSLTRTFTCFLLHCHVLSLSGRMVSALPRLCVLDLSCNALLGQEGDGAGFGQLAASLSHTATLNTLRLQACGLTVDSLRDLGTFSVVLDIFCPLRVTTIPLEWNVLVVFGGLGCKCSAPRPLLCCRRGPSLPPCSDRVGPVI